VTPVRWTYPVFEALTTNEVGGWYAVYEGAGHSNLDFYQPVIKQWWDFKLNDDDVAEAAMIGMLSSDSPWTTQYTVGDGNVILY
jgi:hypothetical protein